MTLDVMENSRFVSQANIRQFGRNPFNMEGETPSTVVNGRDVGLVLFH